MQTIEEYAAYAEQNGYTLGKHATSIINMVNRNEGRRPCKKGKMIKFVHVHHIKKR